MCLCTKFAKLDNCLISLRTKMKIFCWWTLVHGLLSIPIFGSEVCKYFQKVFCWWTLLHGVLNSVIIGYETCAKHYDNNDVYDVLGMFFMFAVIHFYAGILLFLAVQCNLRNEFMFGVVLSTFFPIVGIIISISAYLFSRLSLLYLHADTIVQK
ncbi:uncharacterized protein LOC117781615 isoform X2 [Drosophila innubila]|uniref:uncharacterized protein LOC117781615 isoform X2 n=1 Tax=Drosophila innubila TaxID=198719 RepID=UPI00148D6D0C|nr:uncharacterized protein LOC117781615 isoform X2 [Drosophila innubila]